MKKILAVLMSICIVFSLCPVQARAISGDIYMIGAEKIRGVEYSKINVKTDKAIPLSVEVAGVTVKGNLKSLPNIAQAEVNKAIKQAFLEEDLNENKLLRLKADIDEAKGLKEKSAAEIIFNIAGCAILGIDPDDARYSSEEKHAAFIDHCTQTLGNKPFSWMEGKLLNAVGVSGPTAVAYNAIKGSPKCVKYLSKVAWENEKVSNMQPIPSFFLTEFLPV